MVDNIAPAVAEPPAGAPPVADVAPVVETAAAESPEATVVETPAEAPSAIEAAAEPVEAQAAPAEPEPSAPEGDKPEATAAEAAPEVPLPTYEPFVIPEGLEAPPAELLDEFTGLLGKSGVNQEAGQALMDLHGKVMQQATERMAQHQRDVFDQTRAGWVREFAKENGNRRDTVLADAKSAITTAIPNATERQRVWEALRATGAGDHPAVIKAFANLGAKLRERPAPAPHLPNDPERNLTPADRRYRPRAT
jgi:hypothetical protein